MIMLMMMMMMIGVILVPQSKDQGSVHPRRLTTEMPIECYEPAVSNRGPRKVM